MGSPGTAGLEIIFDNCYQPYQISAAIFNCCYQPSGRFPRRPGRPDRRGERPVLNTTIMLFLVQDGITNGAIYALLGLALVLVFAVMRVILIPQGEFVTYGALTYASLSSGQMPGTARLAVAMGIVAFALDLFTGRKSLHLKLVARALAVNIVLPAAILALTAWLAGRHPPIAVSIALSLVIVALIGLFLY